MALNDKTGGCEIGQVARTALDIENLPAHAALEVVVMTKMGGLESCRLAWQLDGSYVTGFNQRLQISIDRRHSESCDRLLRSFQDLGRQQGIPRTLNQ